ncbi:hypothetical protein BDR05DRAFT_905820 [Suillus weaverae]|nr:hypothetical protein BDR05DRAFT_905820 [Suillus weaverae]
MILCGIVLLSFSFKIHGLNDTTISRNSECRAVRHFLLSMRSSNTQHHEFSCIILNGRASDPVYCSSVTTQCYLRE